jgi:hypothetical protein
MIILPGRPELQDFILPKAPIAGCSIVLVVALRH